MPPKKVYGPGDAYEVKLRNVMKRLGVSEFNWNYDRFGAWIEFNYKNQVYRFDHNVARAQARKVKINYGSDAFAQLVLALEDLARLVERGIYDLQIWVAGMKFLPAPTVVPECFRVLGFDRVPADPEEIRARYKLMAKSAHPDAGGSTEEFQQLQTALEQALQYLGSLNSGGAQ